MRIRQNQNALIRIHVNNLYCMEYLFPEYEVMNFVSPTLWHFIRPFETKGDLLEPLLESILAKDGKSGTLLKDFRKTEFHERRIFQQKPEGEEDRAGLGAPETPILLEPSHIFLEPKSVCFADIPLNFLPIHYDRYAGVGLGFKRRRLLERAPNLKTVWYIPKIDYKKLEEFSVPYGKDEKKRILHGHVKIDCPPNEDFEIIYKEREWRILDDFQFYPEDLSAIIFPDRKTMAKAIETSKLKNWFGSGVSLLSFEDYFESRRKPKI